LKNAIVVGSGAGGATVAKELQGEYAVTVLEAGGAFRPFTTSVSNLEKLRATGILFDERLIQLIFPAMKISKTEDGVVVVYGVGTGGTTTISTANAVRKDGDLLKLGIDLDVEFKELSEEIPISAEHRRKWQALTAETFEVCREMGLQPVVTPKMTDFSGCVKCGRCVFGCPQGAKWDTRHFLDQALAQGARLVTGCKVKKVIIRNGRAAGVEAVAGGRLRFYPADLVILAAGGLGTPVILENSAIKCERNLFVDPVLCVAAEWKGAGQNHEIPMPYIIQKENFIISPYFDFLSFFFNKKWKLPARDIFSLQIKLADSNCGYVAGRSVHKTLTAQDKAGLNAGVQLCTEILMRLGIKKDSVFTGTINAGHPGGTLPLTEREADNLHCSLLPENLYIADATLLPASLGNPPAMTIMALAKRIGRLCRMQA